MQLHIPALGPQQALHWAAAYHRDAALASGVAGAISVRAEILTVEEFEGSLLDYDQPNPAAAPSACASLLCEELYTATRGLVTATTPGQLTDVVAGFVTAVGGRAEPGTPRPEPGLIDVDVSVEGGSAFHARAEAVSVAGLIIEQSLPTLLGDARRAAVRLRQQHQHHLQGNPPTGPASHERQNPQTAKPTGGLP